MPDPRGDGSVRQASFAGEIPALLKSRHFACSGERVESSWAGMLASTFAFAPPDLAQVPPALCGAAIDSGIHTRAWNDFLFACASPHQGPLGRWPITAYVATRQQHYLPS